MASTYLYIMVAVIVGVAIALQAIINSQLNKTVDIFLTSLVVNLVATTTAIIMYLLFSRASFTGLRQAEGWAFLGGTLGVIIIMGSAYLIPRLGVGLASGIMIVSQLTFAMIADHYGLLGIQVLPVNWFKIAGLGFMIIGLVLFFSYRA